MDKLKMNTKHVVPIHSYYVELSKSIDDADWLGDTDQADILQKEHDHIKELIDQGETYYPKF